MRLPFSFRRPNFYFSTATKRTPSNLSRVVEGIRFLDADALERAVYPVVPTKNHLKEKLRLLDAEFWNLKKSILKKPIVAISSIGGFPIVLDGVPEHQIGLRVGSSVHLHTPKDLAQSLKQVMGSQSTHTYMNPQNKTLEQLYAQTIKQGHYSLGHATLIGFYLLGLSKKAELEFDSQRDLIHLARETSARAACQSEPCLIALTEEGAAFGEQVLQQTAKIVQTLAHKTKDDLEERNALFPLSACVSLGINADLRNLQKLVSAIDDFGKELEYRSILALMNDSLSCFFPEWFKSNKDYGHDYPKSWATASVNYKELSKMPLQSKPTLLLLGAPGVGKTVLTTEIMKQKQLGVFCVSTGNLVRALDIKVKEHPEDLRPVEQYAAQSLELMRQGQLMNDDAVYALLMDYISPGGEGYEAYSKAKLVILDGVLKAHRNIASFNKALDAFNKTSPYPMNLETAVDLVASEEVLIQRQAQRVEQASIQRPDDAIAVYKERLTKYMEGNKDLTEYYGRQNQLISVDSTENFEHTYNELLKVIYKSSKRTSQEDNDPLISLQEPPVITARSNPESTALRVVVITNNDEKFKEFCDQLEGGYGVDVRQQRMNREDINSKDGLVALGTQIMAEQPCSPHFILREETTLRDVTTGADLSQKSKEELEEYHLNSVVHTSTLKVLKPQWDSEQKLHGFTLRHYDKRAYGYIKKSDSPPQQQNPFFWDDCFVNAATNLTITQFKQQYGKQSARQHTISAFIENYLFYKTLRTFKYHQLPLKRSIDFGAEHVPISQFIKDEPHLSNPHVNNWGLVNLRNTVLNEGVFNKAASSRTVKNYFSPPFSGIPQTPKQNSAAEMIFWTHDLFHHLICDPVCNVPPTQMNFFVYNAWRMSSEACTLVLADMFFADSLIQSGVDKASVDKRIYPLFECIQSLHFVSDSLAEKTAFIKSLLLANVRYALLGDDSGWRTLLTQKDGTINEQHESCLNAYKKHFEKFFIGDNAWTRANFDNLYAHQKPLHDWINAIGEEQFRASNIPLLSDITQEIQQRNRNTKEYSEVALAVFHLIFDTRIAPALATMHPVELEDASVLQSRAFRRFLIGQCSLFSRYPEPLNLGHIPKQLFARIQDPKEFTHQEQNELRELMTQYILGLDGIRIITRDQALNFTQCIPVFPPVYISYKNEEKKFGSIIRCIEQCVQGYKEVIEPTKVSQCASTLFAPKIDVHNLLNETKEHDELVKQPW